MKVKDMIASQVGNEFVWKRDRKVLRWSAEGAKYRQAKEVAQQSRRGLTCRSAVAACGKCLPKKLASLGFGRRATPAQKAQVVQKLRHEFSLDLLLTIAQLPHATFYYHLKRMRVLVKYKEVEAEIVAIYHGNKERYEYRRITIELHNHGFSINHKTVQRLMKELGLVCRVRIKKYCSYKGKWKKLLLIC